MSQVNSSSN